MQSTPPRWPMFNRVKQHADLMDQVLDASNIDVIKVVREDHGKAIARARTICLHCQLGDRCQARLEAGNSQRRPPRFCPNAVFLDKFKRAQN